MVWTIEFKSDAAKQVKRLNKRAIGSLRLLIEDLRQKGPAPGKGWPHYGKLKGLKNQDKRHCHLIRGKPTYVCCWSVVDKKMKIIEVYYIGTHEKAPY